MEFNQESNENKLDEEKTSNDSKNFKQLFQDNLRIIVSIIIVILIAGGIYSYSKRTQSPESVSEVAMEKNQENTETEDSQSEDVSEKTPENSEENISSSSTSQETENSFIETAAKGDSKTILARKALVNFLEKNSDDSLTAEHKIYIEDFLRKNVKVEGNGRIFVGTSMEFSKQLIQDGIAKSKNLNERQLQNLHKYALRVPSLS